MIIGTDDNDNDVILPFTYQNNLITYKVAVPSEEELTTLPMYVLTSDLLWETKNAGCDLRYHRQISTKPFLTGKISILTNLLLIKLLPHRFRLPK